MPSRSVDPGTELLLERLRPFPARVFSRTNVARYVFLHPLARELFPDWEVMMLWECYDVNAFAQGHKVLRHPEVGVPTLRYQSLLIEGTPGPTTPGSSSTRRIELAVRPPPSSTPGEQRA
ncbi:MULTISPECIES: hypothetical protein [Streptomyces]|uniref:MmyB-like transcription regulator ligand binding domain-containing protein n=2 Tax=Streptomyces TaxID=1883 RepID=A0ABV9ILQ2_9ACTN